MWLSPVRTPQWCCRFLWMHDLHRRHLSLQAPAAHMQGVSRLKIDLGKTWSPTGPRGPKSWKNSRSPSGIEIFKRDWNEWHFQARLKISSEPPTKPLFLWGILKVKIENFKRDWSFQAKTWNFQAKTWNFQAFKRDWFFSRFGPSGDRKTPEPSNLVAPYRAILRYYRCDTPYRAILFKEG